MNKQQIGYVTHIIGAFIMPIIIGIIIYQSYFWLFPLFIVGFSMYLIGLLVSMGVFGIDDEQ